MDGSKYYGENRYLSSIFHKQERQSRPVQMEETNPPFHFMKREMTEEETKQMLQKKIFDNPSLYISTHVLMQQPSWSARSATATSRSSRPTTTRSFTPTRRSASAASSTRTTTSRTSTSASDPHTPISSIYPTVCICRHMLDDKMMTKLWAWTMQCFFLNMGYHWKFKQAQDKQRDQAKSKRQKILRNLILVQNGR